jgi:hypothetical protein
MIRFSPLERRRVREEVSPLPVGEEPGVRATPFDKEGLGGFGRLALALLQINMRVLPQ